MKINILCIVATAASFVFAVDGNLSLRLTTEQSSKEEAFLKIYSEFIKEDYKSIIDELHKELDFPYHDAYDSNRAVYSTMLYFGDKDSVPNDEELAKEILDIKRQRLKERIQNRIKLRTISLSQLKVIANQVFDNVIATDNKPRMLKIVRSSVYNYLRPNEIQLEHPNPYLLEYANNMKIRDEDLYSVKQLSFDELVSIYHHLLDHLVNSKNRTMMEMMLDMLFRRGFNYISLKFVNDINESLDHKLIDTKQKLLRRLRERYVTGARLNRIDREVALSIAYRLMNKPLASDEKHVLKKMVQQSIRVYFLKYKARDTSFKYEEYHKHFIKKLNQYYSKRKGIITTIDVLKKKDLSTSDYAIIQHFLLDEAFQSRMADIILQNTQQYLSMKDIHILNAMLDNA